MDDFLMEILYFWVYSCLLRLIHTRVSLFYSEIKFRMNNWTSEWLNFGVSIINGFQKILPKENQHLNCFESFISAKTNLPLNSHNLPVNLRRKFIWWPLINFCFHPKKLIKIQCSDRPIKKDRKISTNY